MKWDTVNAVDSWHFNKAQRNKKKKKIQQKSMNNWAYLVKWKENEFRVGKKKILWFFSVYLLDLILFRNKAWMRLHTSPPQLHVAFNTLPSTTALPQKYTPPTGKCRYKKYFYMPKYICTVSTHTQGTHNKSVTVM